MLICEFLILLYTVYVICERHLLLFVLNQFFICFLGEFRHKSHLYISLELQLCTRRGENKNDIIWIDFCCKHCIHRFGFFFFFWIFLGFHCYKSYSILTLTGWNLDLKSINRSSYICSANLFIFKHTCMNIVLIIRPKISAAFLSLMNFNAIFT